MKKPFTPPKSLCGIAFEEQAALVGGEMTPGDVGGNALGARKFLGVLKQDAVTRLGPRLDGAVVQRLAGIGDDEVEVEVDGVAESLAARARAVGIVEGEQARLGLLVNDAVVFAFEAIVEDQALGGISRGVGHEFENSFAIPFAIADLDGIDQAGSRFRIDREAIDDHPDGLREIDVEKRFGRRKFVQASVLIQAVEAALLDVAQGVAQSVLIRRARSSS